MSSEEIAMGFTRRIDVGLTQEEAVERVTTALHDQGFGILTQIDVQQTLADKIGVQIPPHLILGACNPQLAAEALGVDPRVAALLPCNVVVRQDGDDTLIEALDPDLMATISGVDALRPIAADAAARITAALDAVADGYDCRR